MNEVVFEKLGNIEGKLDGVLIRLDKINGAVQRHEQDIIDLKLTKSYTKGALKVANLVIGAVGALIALILSPIIAKIVVRFTQ